VVNTTALLALMPVQWWAPWALGPRLTAGVAILTAMAWSDWRRHGRNARRWREYLFLIACAALAAAYAVINDQITCRISWEFFYYFKDLWRDLGPATPPLPGPLSWGAAKVGLAAGWWVGLLLGAALLMANNPRVNRLGQTVPGMALPRLFMFAGFAVAAAIVLSIVLGYAGYVGWLNPLDSDFRDLWAQGQWHPQRFTCCWGIHLGAYTGALMGGAVAVFLVWRRDGIETAV
jgi:hypothetical protein